MKEWRAATSGGGARGRGEERPAEGGGSHPAAPFVPWLEVEDAPSYRYRYERAFPFLSLFFSLARGQAKLALV